MATVKVKFRTSCVPGHAGVLFIQLIHDRKVKLITTAIHLFREEWDDTKESIVFDVSNIERLVYLHSLQKELDAKIEKLNNIIRQLENTGKYTLSDILTLFNDKSRKLSFDFFMHERIRQLEKSGQKRTANTYKTTLRVFLNFWKKNSVNFTDINEDSLYDFEQHLLARGLVKNTTSFYMRILRAVYSAAISANLIQEKNPFKRVYTGVAKTEKRAVHVDVVKKLKSLENLTESLDLSRDLFLFSFYTRGMSFVDIFYLKKENIINDVLVYKRMKTGQILHVKMENCMYEILRKYTLATNNSDYLFPLYNKNSGQTIYLQYTSALRLHNKRLRKLSQSLKLEKVLTSYVARHTWASVAKEKGIAISIISECMGHTSETTTQIYLASFDKKVIDKANLSVISL